MRLLSVAMLLILLSLPRTVYAHGFGERYDLPVPLWLYIWGAAAVVLISFIAIIRLVKRGNAQPILEARLAVPRIVTRIILHDSVRNILQIAGVVTFIGILATGFIGSANPNYNFAPTAVWVIW
jgi:hypothetical protein